MHVEEFQQAYPSLDSYWRSIILFGRNVASYKFALAKSLLEIAPTGKSEVYLEELAEPFSRHLCEHIAVAPKQVTSQSSKFLDACQNYNTGAITHQKLIDTTVSLGFNNVIDAFHVVNERAIPIAFYEKDYSRAGKKIILTDDIFQLTELPNSDNFMVEAEARWNLVETAWALNLPRNLLNVQYDDMHRALFVEDAFRRTNITSARGALNGYQKGKCFYCFRDINVTEDAANDCDVDHFFPHTLQRYMPDVNLDGVWNLVLACPECNRGVNGKFAKVPDRKYLLRLHKRNEFLINSHHPLRETIINQTGKTEQERRIFFRDINQRAVNYLIHTWDTPQVAPATF